MAKMVTEVLGQIKGEDKINETLTGKGAFSKAAFGDVVSALANDSTYNIPTFDNKGQTNGTINISELIRQDIKKTLDKLGWPSKSESGMLDSCEIVTKGLAQAIPYIVEQQMMCGKKFELPATDKFVGSIHLADVEAKTKTIDVFDPSTRTNLGTAEITTQPSIAIKAKSPVPSFLKTKVRRDPSGKVIEDKK